MAWCGVGMRMEYAASLGEHLALALQRVEVGLGGLGEVAGGRRVGSVAPAGVGEGKAEIEDEVHGHDDQNGEVDCVEDVLRRFGQHF